MMGPNILMGLSWTGPAQKEYLDWPGPKGIGTSSLLLYGRMNVVVVFLFLNTENAHDN